jgi:hypothetical protein
MNFKFARGVERTAEISANINRSMSELYAQNFECLDDKAWLQWAHGEVSRAESAGVAPRNLTKKMKRILADQMRQVEWLHEIGYFEDDGAGAEDPAPPVRDRKLGRNEPCDCGSGRKAKHCCGAGRVASAVGGRAACAGREVGWRAQRL